MEEKKSEAPQNNKRVLTLTDLVLMGLANIVGAGIFVIIGKSTKYGGDRTILGLILMAIISLIIGFCYIEIYSRFESNITEYLSVRHTMGDVTGQFMIVLLYSFAIFSAVTMVIANSKYITSFGYLSCYKDSTLVQKMLSIFLLCAMSFINYLGITTSKIVATTISVMMLLILGTVILLSANYISWESTCDAPRVPWDSFILSAVLSLFLFNGYDFLVKISDESINPENNKTALVASISITTAIYVAIVVSSICVIGFKHSCGAHNITKMYDVLTNKHTSHIVYIIAAFIMFNATFLTLLSATRFMQGLGKDNRIPFSEFWSQSNSFNSPSNAIYASLIIASLLAIVNNEVIMAVLSNVSCILILLLLSLAVLMLRYSERDDKKSQDKHNYIQGNINNMPVIVIINIIVLIYIFYVLVKNKFWVGKI